MKQCKVEDCNKKHRGKGFCHEHYNEWYRSQFQCSIKDCNGKYFASGYCGGHYFLFKKYGDPLFKSRRSPGEGYIRKDGYKVTFKNRHIFYEHRNVMESIIGRPLYPNEIIHHIDKNPLNNSSENLLITDKHKHPSLHSNPKEKCIFCDNEEFVKQMCKRHYHREWRKSHFK